MSERFRGPPATPGCGIADRIAGTCRGEQFVLIACLIVTQQDHWLNDAGFAWFLVGAFGIGLAAETLMSVSKLRLSQTRDSRSPATNLPTSSNT